MARVIRDDDRRVTHGMTASVEYTAWQHMIDRCTNPRHPHYYRYGGRGISICERWMRFENFLEDMGKRPSNDLTLERNNNDGNYEPSNCRWASRDDQYRNRSSNVWVELHGEQLIVADAMRKLRIFPHGFYHRMRKFGETYQQVVDHYARLREKQSGR